MHARASRSVLRSACLLAGMAAIPMLASASTDPPARVPAGVILVKGAWSSASDSVTPVPEGGTVGPREYNSPYFHLAYPIASGWAQTYEGPPPSDNGYYVLAQIQSPDAPRSARGSVLIAAQDMFFNLTPARSAVELVRYVRSHLRGDYVVERPPTEVKVAGHSFTRLDYVSPAAGLHWTILATQIRCHTVQFTLTSTDPAVNERLIGEMSAMKLPDEAGLSAGTGGGESVPVCIQDYVSSGSVLHRNDPILTDHRHNPIPVRIVIDTNGRVKHIHFISSFPEQAKLITDALQQWRFKPYVVNGKASEVETGILFGAAASKALISGKQDPQLVPARKQAPT